jgi:hypothetical protein
MVTTMRDTHRAKPRSAPQSARTAYDLSSNRHNVVPPSPCERGCQHVDWCSSHEVACAHFRLYSMPPGQRGDTKIRAGKWPPERHEATHRHYRACYPGVDGHGAPATAGSVWAREPGIDPELKRVLRMPWPGTRSRA